MSGFLKTAVVLFSIFTSTVQATIEQKRVSDIAPKCNTHHVSNIYISPGLVVVNLPPMTKLFTILVRGKECVMDTPLEVFISYVGNNYWEVTMSTDGREIRWAYGYKMTFSS